MAVCLMVTSCAASTTALPAGTPEPVAVAVSPEPTANATAVPTSTAEPTTAPEPSPQAITTTTGVPVIVLSSVGDNHVVRTPCGNEAIVVGGEPIIGPLVVLDPGHGGEADPGAPGANGLLEGALNLDLATAVRTELTVRGITTALTRTGDYLVPLRVRAEFADGLDAELMVSIHHNAPAGDASDTPGTEVFVQTGSGESARLGGLLYEEVTAALGALEVAWTTAPDAGVLRTLLEDGTDAYGIIRRPATPTALVELGYIANPAEADLFATEEYIVTATEALADAIEAYLTTDRAGTGFGGDPRTFRPDPAPGADVCTDPPLR
jgi:N-acetylmuramoyl-L-alanine amidase